MEAKNISPQAQKVLQSCAGCFLICLVLFIAIAMTRTDLTTENLRDKMDVTELTTEEEIMKATNLLLGETNKYGDSRLNEVSIWDNEDGSKRLVVDYNANDYAKIEMTKTYLWEDAKKFFSTVAPLLSPEINKVILSANIKTIDTYGNIEYTKAMWITMSRDNWEIIQWETFRTENLQIVADEYKESYLLND